MRAGPAALFAGSNFLLVNGMLSDAGSVDLYTTVDLVRNEVLPPSNVPLQVPMHFGRYVVLFCTSSELVRPVLAGAPSRAHAADGAAGGGQRRPTAAALSGERLWHPHP